MPLAICDRTTVRFSDLYYQPNIAEGAVGNACFAKPWRSNENMGWYIYPQMMRDEASVFATWDTHVPGPTRIHVPIYQPTLHTAVDLPGSEGK